MKKVHPNLGAVTVLETNKDGTTLVALESGEKRTVTTEWLKEPTEAKPSE